MDGRPLVLAGTARGSLENSSVAKGDARVSFARCAQERVESAAGRAVMFCASEFATSAAPSNWTFWMVAIVARS